MTDTRMDDARLDSPSGDSTAARAEAARRTRETVGAGGQLAAGWATTIFAAHLRDVLAGKAGEETHATGVT